MALLAVLSAKIKTALLNQGFVRVRWYCRQLVALKGDGGWLDSLFLFG